MSLSYFALASLVLLLLPVLILPWERVQVPNALFVAIAACGLFWRAVLIGPEAAFWSALAGLGVLAGVAIAVQALRSLHQLRLLTGTHIKLLATGATWLGPWGVAGLLVVAPLMLVCTAVLTRQRGSRRPPDFAFIAGLTIFAIAFDNYLPIH